MGLLDGLQSLLYGSPQSSAPPAYQPYQGTLPTYNNQLSGQAAQTQNQLGDVLQGRLSAYQNGQSTLAPAYRQAVLSDAQNTAGQAAKVGSQNLVEQMNENGLLNSSATGYGLGKIQNQYQLSMQNAADYLTQQDLGSLNSLQGAAQGNVTAQQNAANSNAQGQAQIGEFGYTAGLQNQQNQYNSQLAQYQAQQSQRQNLLTGLFGLGKAAITAAG